MKPIKDYPLAVRKRARAILRARWDRQSRQPPQQAPAHLVEIVEPGPPYLVPLPGGMSWNAPEQVPDPILQKPLAVRKLARALARAKLDRKYPPKK